MADVSSNPDRCREITPEEWLDIVAPREKKGVLKLFVGYAPGVGKTYSMLSEGIHRRQRGEDVVIGVAEAHGRPRTAELATQLESVPLRSLKVQGAVFGEMDLDGVLARNPQVALVDEIAHTNVEGSRHRKRYEDVLELLDAGISVLSTVNIQHVETVAPVVERLNGVSVQERIPEWVLKRADEVVMTDLTSEALQTRLRRGDIYPGEQAEGALMNFFRRDSLIALRELALQQVASAVDRNLEHYALYRKLSTAWSVRELIVVCISSRPAAQELIVRGARVANRLGGDLYVVHVRRHSGSREPAAALAANLQFARNMNASIVELEGPSVPRAIAAFAGQKQATQVIVGRRAVRGVGKYLYFRQVRRFLGWAPSVELHIVTETVPGSDVRKAAHDGADRERDTAGHVLCQCGGRPAEIADDISSMRKKG